MFQFFNQAGFPVGLAKVAQAMGIPQEKLMDGADAPKGMARRQLPASDGLLPG
jgi:hypothetical protein